MAPLTSPDAVVNAHHLFERDAGQALSPTDDQKITLYIIAGYIVGILILWNLPVIKVILSPFKLLTVGLHEFSHAFVGILTCARIISIEIDPDEGGLTKMRGGNPYLTLPAGYLGSSLIGALMIFCGFNVLASKVASLFLGVCLLIVLFFARNWLTRGIGLLFMGLIVFLWWLEGGKGLKYFVLFLGVMSCLYCVWDILDDLVLRKVNTSDAARFAELSNTSAQCWGIIWLIISIIFLICAVLAGLAAFKEDQTTQQTESNNFLPWNTN